MTNIFIDANEANVANLVGTGHYTLELLRYWHRYSHHNFTLLLKSSPLKHLPQSKSNWKYQVIKPAKAWSRFALPLYLKTHPHQADVFWGPAHYLPPFNSIPSVVTIHDLAYEYFPSLFNRDDLYKLRRWTKQAVKQASKIIAVSNATKQDLINLYHLSPAKIEVVYNGYNQDLFNTHNKPNQQALSQYSLTPANYLLFLGTLQPRKNVVNLVRAFQLLKSQGYAGKLVLAGKIGWLAQDTLAEIKASPNHQDIVMTGYIDDRTRHDLYSYADVFILPSLYEGFGVPVLEAMASGCPVVASDNSSLPEVVGKAGLLFNPQDPQDIADKIIQLQQHRSKYIKLGLNHVQQFSWQTSAKTTIELITSNI